MSHFPSFSDAYGAHPARLPSALPAPLPPPRFPRSLPPPPVPVRSLSDTSTKMTELSSCRASELDAYASAHMGERYIPILPRTSSHAHYNKRCETCSASHDGSFGAGRFCSSRCARTVGGLAHRKKRLMERESKQRHAVQKRLSNKRLRAAVVSYKNVCSFDEQLRVGSMTRVAAATAATAAPPALREYAPAARFDAAAQRAQTGDSALTTWSSLRSSPASVMTITSLLNPCE